MARVLVRAKIVAQVCKKLHTGIALRSSKAAAKKNELYAHLN
jgi:hypothetical protein